MTDDDLPTADDVRGILKADIVERLREYASGIWCASSMIEAADEIERLRTLRVTDREIFENLHNVIERLQAELKELGAELYELEIGSMSRRSNRERPYKPGAGS